MKRILLGIVMLLGCGALVASADTYTYSLLVTNGQAATISDQLPISGELDKIEISPSLLTATNAVLVATYDAAGTTVVDTYCTNSAAGNAIFRPRVIGTPVTSTTPYVGVASPTGTNTTTVLMAQYERMLIGSNVRISMSGIGGIWSGATATNNTVTVRIYYKPLPAK
jgi:hypothetical protein